MKVIRIGKATLEQAEVGKQKCYSGSPYSEIITTEVPISWYFTKDGTFDGVSIGPSAKGFSNYESVLLDRILGTLKSGGKRE